MAGEQQENRVPTMQSFTQSLVHTPLTPFTSANAIDYDRLAKLIDFHIRHGAQALAIPMHAGESVSLTDVEKREIIAFAIKTAGKVPVVAHVSDAGTGIAVALARHAESVGAAAVIATTPYYWTPPPHMILDHFATIAAAVSVPFLVHNAPDEMAGVKVTAELALKLIDKAKNFAGVVDATLDWQFMIELMTDAPRLRPGFRLFTGPEYMVSAAATGATGVFSSLAAIAPNRVRELNALCASDKLVEARAAQFDLAALRQALKPLGVAGLKAAAQMMGRYCGEPRAPLMSLTPAARDELARQIEAIPGLKGEPKGW
jgi:4-hydroxy-tetrahydrodipicolinate synthase